MRRKTRIMILAIAVLCGLVLSPPDAQAALVMIQIEAVVDNVWDAGNYLEGKINGGDLITGSYTYDTDTADSEPLAYAGLYQHDAAPAGMSLHLGGFDFVTDPANVDFIVAILNDSPPSGQDQIWMTSYNNLSLSNGAAVDGISWQLDAPSGTAISSTELPTSPVILHDWQSLYGLRLHGERGRYIIDATVTSAIPEPASVSLLVLGALFLRKRRHT